MAPLRICHTARAKHISSTPGCVEQRGRSLFASPSRRIQRAGVLGNRPSRAWKGAIVSWNKRTAAISFGIAAVLALAALSFFNLSSAQDAANTSTEVRINARPLADGRVEFGLQQRVNGGWSERILPNSRKLPADAVIDRWLSSSSVDLATTTASAPEIYRTEGVTLRQTIPPYTFAWVETYQDATGAEYLRSRIGIPATNNAGPLLILSCDGGVRHAWITNLDLEPAGSHSRYYAASYKLWPLQEKYLISTISDLNWEADKTPTENDGKYEWRNYADVRLDTRFYWHLRDSTVVRVDLIGNGASSRLTFSLDGAWGFEIIPNLDYCGRYYAGQDSENLWVEYHGNGH